MYVREAMTTKAEYIAPDTSLRKAAEKMRELDCGFLPVSDEKGKKLIGVITDRDITIRGVATGLDPERSVVSDIVSGSTLYCFADDALETAADSMRKKGVHRLIVLNNRDEKDLLGIISLGDIFRHNQETLATNVARDIYKKAA